MSKPVNWVKTKNGWKSVGSAGDFQDAALHMRGAFIDIALSLRRIKAMSFEGQHDEAIIQFAEGFNALAERFESGRKMCLKVSQRLLDKKVGGAGYQELEEEAERIYYEED